MSSKIFTWYLLFNKRLFKRSSFIFLLITIISISFFMKYSSLFDFGMITVAVCSETEESKNFSDNLIKSFDGSKNILHFIKADSEKDAKTMLREDKVQAVWIFDDDIKNTLSLSAESESIQPLVTIIEKQDTVFMKLSRELLFNRIFPHFSYSAYKAYIRNVVKLDNNSVSDEILKSYYEKYLDSEPLIKIQNLNNEIEEKGYFLAPLRGMLALWILVSAFAACFYYMQDSENGIFVWIKRKNQFALMLGMNLIVVSNICIFFLISVACTGLFTTVFSEFLNLALYCISVVLFATFFMLIFSKIERLAFVVAPVILMSFVFTPVFVNIPAFKFFSYFLPGYYYLNGIFDFSFTLKFIYYIFAFFVIDFIIFKIKSRI